jgi:hypothetical protein
MMTKSVSRASRPRRRRTGQHDADLRHDPAGLRVPPEQIAEAGQAPDAFLDARADRIEQRDDRNARRRRHLEQAADLLRVNLRERTAQHGEVLGEHRDATAVDEPETRDDAVAGITLLLEAERRVAMRDVRTDFLERVGVEQALDAFAGGELALRVLRVDALLAAAAVGS